MRGGESPPNSLRNIEPQSALHDLQGVAIEDLGEPCREFGVILYKHSRIPLAPDPLGHIETHMGRTPSPRISMPPTKQPAVTRPPSPMSGSISTPSPASPAGTNAFTPCSFHPSRKCSMRPAGPQHIYGRIITIWRRLLPSSTVAQTLSSISAQTSLPFSYFQAIMHALRRRRGRLGIDVRHPQPLGWG